MSIARIPLPLKRNPFSADSVFCIIFGFLIALLYRHVLNSFWLFDDLYLLRHITEHNPVEFFINPGVWQKISLSSLTPWITVSFYSDFLASGFHQKFFYLHQLVSIWLAAALLYLVLRQFVETYFAFAAGLLFIMSAPIAAAAEMLMVRHYIEGLIFFLLCLLFFVRALREDSLLFLFLASLFYFLAMSAKEIYVPLGLIVLFLPETNLRKRFSYAGPFIIIFLLYAGWRFVMLGDLIGGTGGTAALLSSGIAGSSLLFFRDVYGSFLMMAGITEISGPFGMLISFCLAFFPVLSGIYLFREKKYSTLLFWGAIFLAVYSVPFMAANLQIAAHDFISYRLAISIAAYLAGITSLSAGFLFRRFRKIRVKYLKIIAECSLLSLFAISFLFISWNSFHWIANQKKLILNPLKAEGNFFMKTGKGFLMVNYLPIYSPPHYYENLEFFKHRFLKENSPSVVDGFFAYIDTPGALQGVRIFKYDPSIGEMSEITEAFLHGRTDFLSRVKKLPLSARLSVVNGVFTCAVGPSDLGRYFLLLGYKHGVYSTAVNITRSFSVRGSTGATSYIRVGWESPEGFMTFSPEWFVDFSENQDIEWKQ